MNHRYFFKKVHIFRASVSNVLVTIYSLLGLRVDQTTLKRTRQSTDCILVTQTYSSFPLYYYSYDSRSLKLGCDKLEGSYIVKPDYSALVVRNIRKCVIYPNGKTLFDFSRDNYSIRNFSGFSVVNWSISWRITQSCHPIFQNATCM